MYFFFTLCSVEEKYFPKLTDIYLLGTYFYYLKYFK